MATEKESSCAKLLIVLVSHVLIETFLYKMEGVGKIGAQGAR